MWTSPTIASQSKSEKFTDQKIMNELYPDAVEDLPPNAPNLIGRFVQISCFIDADYGGEK